MRTVLTVFIFFVSLSAISQSEILAKHYFDQGEYEKALSIYKKLEENNPGRIEYFLAIVESHQQLEEFETAEKLLKQKLQSARIIPDLLVELGYNYSLENKEELARVEYKKAIDYLDENPRYAYTIGRAFEKYNLLDEAVPLYEKAMQLDSELDFNVQLARIYGEQGDLEKMFNTYLDLMKSQPRFRSTIQRNFSVYVNEDPENEANVILRKTLLNALQQNPDVMYNQLLSWLFIQQKEYSKAFTQEKAIFRRSEGNLSGIKDLAYVALSDKSYEDAQEILNFIVENATSDFEKLQAEQNLMRVALETAKPEDYPEVEKKFEALLDAYGRDIATYLLQIDYNHFLAFNEGKIEEAIANLKTLANDNLNYFQEARVKMELADILVFDEKFNQALIYYSQIQKKVQNDELAQEARFKVAKTSYYKGDFEWAQTQLDVLKKSASQLIANDAMELSLMIRDNTLEDSTQTALKKYAKADLLALQNKNEEAIVILDDILTNHKGEKIEDEALLKQANLFEKTEQVSKAEANYNKLIQLYNDDILADDAHYLLAKLYEEKLNQPEKAKELYEQIIFNFSDSIYYVEARNRFRALRGDAIN